MPSRLIATALGLLGFFVATVSGLMAGHPSMTLFEAESGPVMVSGAGATLLRALLSLLACYAVGWILGEVARRAVDESVEVYKKDHPLEADDPADQPEAAGDEPTEAAREADPSERLSAEPA
ncbi:MAG: hypothetical protein R3236_07495 [Phycisphaeraceae bacterium]|nr:hypothetical protein [Phycisphaeraceae bacterium]